MSSASWTTSTSRRTGCTSRWPGRGSRRGGSVESGPGPDSSATRSHRARHRRDGVICTSAPRRATTELCLAPRGPERLPALAGLFRVYREPMRANEARSRPAGKRELPPASARCCRGDQDGSRADSGRPSRARRARGARGRGNSGPRAGGRALPRGLRTKAARSRPHWPDQRQGPGAPVPRHVRRLARSGRPTVSR